MSDKRPLAETLTQLDLHNRLAGDLVESLVRPVRESGGTPADAMILLESVVIGVLLILVEECDDEEALRTLFERLLRRLPEVRARREPEQRLN